MLALREIEAAARRIEPFVRRTPLERSRTLSERLVTGTKVIMKGGVSGEAYVVPIATNTEKPLPSGG